MPCTGCGACCDNLGFDLEGWRPTLKHRATDPVETEERRHEAQFILGHWSMRADAVDRWDSTCDQYDPATRRCLAYTDRPPICRDYPYYSDGPNLARLERTPEQCGYRDDWQPVTIRSLTRAA